MPGREQRIGALRLAETASGGEEFWIAASDETWLHGRCVASRQSWGMARRRGSTLMASDLRDDAMVVRCREAATSAAAQLRGVSALSRIVTRVTSEEGDVQVETTVVLTRNSMSVVTTTDHWMEDDQLLLRLATPEPRESIPSDLPLLWSHGSAAVLLHEAAGHAAEHGAATASWPPWLRVMDQSRSGAADLLHGETPRATRRQSFVDVPLPRMTAVVVEHSSAPFDLPDEHIEVLLIGGGAYDPVTDEVTIHVAASRAVRALTSRSLQPFTLRAPRRLVAASLRGAAGPAERYPGVICSREGQELFVSSEAPQLLTAALPLA